jgi:O-acetyl-ADP-ribose deacetylase (regulator of RNase III)
MIAYSYRSTITVGRNLSPFEILFGRPMMLEVDWKLLSDSTATPPELVEELKPKLRALQLVAMHNAQSNADRQRKHANEKSVEPTFKIGQKVLLYDPTTKVHEPAKLKVRYKGPYEILKEVAKYRYILQDLVSGKQTPRPVHADRIRPFYELADDERVRGTTTDVCLAALFTQHRRLKIRVTVADITTSQCDVIVNMIGTQLGMLSGSARDVFRCLHEDITQTCHEFIQTGQFDQPLETKATGLKEPIKYILHIVTAERKTPDDNSILVNEETLRNRIVNCLLIADKLPDIKSIAIPFPDMQGIILDRWAICQNLAKAVLEFDESSKQVPGTLETIEFVNLTLCVADSMCVISKQLFLDEQPAMVRTESTTQQNSQPHVNSQAQAQDTGQTDQTSPEWFPIKKLIKMQIRKGKEFFLVQWESENDPPSWEPRGNITDEAVREFFAEERRKRNRRKC